MPNPNQTTRNLPSPPDPPLRCSHHSTTSSRTANAARPACRLPPQNSSKTFKKTSRRITETDDKSPCASGQRAAELQRGGWAAPLLVGFVRAFSAACCPAKAPTRPPHFVYLWVHSPTRIFSLLTHRSSTATHSPRLRPCSRNSRVQRVGDVIGARLSVRVFVCLWTVARGGGKLAVGWVGAEEEEEQEGEVRAAVLSSPPPWLSRRS